jgi:PPP family 3-phenylpropionic acid transporter
MRVALALTVVRWLGLAWAPSLGPLAALQLLHAASYALLHTASLQLVDILTPPGRKAFGQSLLSAMAYGVGVSGGLALAGVLAPLWPASWLYLGAAAAAFLGLVAALAAKDPTTGSR